MGYFFVDESRCLNYNYQKNNCRNCREACPNGCWDEAGRTVPERCNGCGLCQAACPADAIGVEGISADEWSAATSKTSRSRDFSCRKQGAGPWSCLGFLSSRDLVALALAGDEDTGCDVVVRDEGCRNCRPNVAEHLEREIAAASAFLGASGRGRIVHGNAAMMKVDAGQRLDRRSFFSSLFKTGVETARNVIWPEAAVTPLKKVAWRTQILRGFAVDQNSQSIFPVLSVAESCIACELCARICPVQAITATKLDESIELEHSPLVCTDCGLCIEHCPEAALTRLAEGPACSSLLIRQAFPRCNECGAAFQPAGRQLTCFDCLAKGSRNIFNP